MIKIGIVLRTLLSGIFFLTVFVVKAQLPASSQKKSILLLNGVAHLGNGKVYQESAVGFKDGKLTLVVNSITTPFDSTVYDTVIDVSGKHIYPGFIAMNSTIGLREIDAIKATLDFSETGTFNPNVRSIIAYNAESKIIPTLRSNGVLIAQITPRDGVIAGTSSIVELDGWNWEDALIKLDDGIHMNWPKIYSNKGWWAEPEKSEKNNEREKLLLEIKDFFVLAKAYQKAPNQGAINLKMEAFKGLFNGSKKLYINANYVKELIEITGFVRELNLENVVVIGGEDAWMIPEMLKDNNISVSLNRIHDLPKRQDDAVDLPYRRPYLLQKANLLYCLNYEGDMEAMGSRNLPFIAGTSVAFGLSKEEALMTITLNPAKILGIDQKVGSLEVGKDATLFISIGDALDMKTNHVELAYIRGKSIDLDNHQKQLYKKFKSKYDLK